MRPDPAALAVRAQQLAIDAGFDLAQLLKRVLRIVDFTIHFFAA